MLRDLRSPSAGFIPLGLAVLALLGSVLIPARQTWLITSLLRESEAVLAPAGLLATQLQFGLAEEMGALQGYVLSPDSVRLGQYRSIATENDERLTRLQNLAARPGAAFLGHVESVRRQIDGWRQVSSVLVAGQGVRDNLPAAVGTAQQRYQSSLAALADLSVDLSATASTRDNRVRELEHLSLISNAVLVLAAFAALTAVIVLSLRERRLARELRRHAEGESVRARQEGALRRAAEALAAAFTIDEVTQRIADAALEVMGGRGAFVELISGRPNEPADMLIVGAVAGSGVPPLGSSCDFAGSYAERVVSSGDGALIPVSTDLDHGRIVSTLSGDAGSVVAVPLRSARAPVGALFVVSARHHFRAEDAARAAIFGHLAALAYEKVRLLDEAVEGRKRLERVIASRSRLMRGFSHDVKNPIGAADGYAALLADGVFGELNPQQHENIARMRRGLRSALALIDELHELARAETGHLSLRFEPVDLADLVRGITEEYQAGANAKGLALTGTVVSDAPIVQTSRSRVYQIVANLLSNAIKYADAGSVTIRGERRSVGPSGDAGSWAVLAVSDTGRGIAADKLDFIFQEFGRIGDGNEAGAGLGLAISRVLAQALGGDVTVTSEPGRGSTFTLWLPIGASHGPGTDVPTIADADHLRRRDRDAHESVGASDATG